MKKTAIAVVVFVILLLIAGYVRAGDGARIGIGQSLINSHLKTAEIGYERNNWEASATLMESGSTKNGEQGKMELYSISYLTRPEPLQNRYTSPFLRLGVSYNRGSELVGRTNFRLGVGMDFADVWRLEYAHHSSAGIHPTNTGIDYVTLTYKMPAPW